jgi:hypothetical protein
VKYKQNGDILVLRDFVLTRVSTVGLVTPLTDDGLNYRFINCYIQVTGHMVMLDSIFLFILYLSFLSFRSYLSFFFKFLRSTFSFFA